MSRSTNRRVELEGESTADTITWVRDGHRTLAITSWKHVLATLEYAAGAGGHAALQQDIVQLRGLTEEMNTGEFLPLREDEVTDANMARRMLNYIGLIEDVAGRLVTDGIAETNPRSQGYSNYATGRYLNLHSRFRLWLGVDLERWRDGGITPIWTEHDTNSSDSGIQGKIRLAGKLFEGTQEVNGWLCIPIRLTTGAERDRVIDGTVRQIRSIAERFLKEFPD